MLFYMFGKVEFVLGVWYDAKDEGGREGKAEGNRERKGKRNVKEMAKNEHQSDNISNFYEKQKAKHSDTFVWVQTIYYLPRKWNFIFVTKNKAVEKNIHKKR